MLFSSPRFFVFLAVLLTLLALPVANVTKKRILLAASCLFYAAWDYRYLALLLAISLIDYYAALRIYTLQSAPGRKLWLALSVISNLVILGYFKYCNFFIANANALLPASARLGAVDILLPAGISFYTFKSMSYTIDVYRGTLEPCETAIDYATFTTFFADLIAGPIVRASTFLPQMNRRIGLTREGLRAGASLFLLGMTKKVIIGDRMAGVVDPVFAHPSDFAASSIACAVVAYAIQIYADFSGYSDMAIGTAKLIGYDLPENFNMPYLSTNVTEFWRRWHITLSNWLRDYLYIPLGGNRKGAARTYLNLTVTMLLGGLWHGASWNFVLWGALHGVALAIHRAISRRPNHRPLPGFIAGPITLVFVVLCWIPFRSQSWSTTSTILHRLFAWETSGARFAPEALGWGLGLVVVGHLVFVALERDWWRSLTTKITRAIELAVCRDDVCGTYVVLGGRTIGGAFVLTTWVLAVFLFGAAHVSPFIYFQF